jgi:hypothetical protein
MLRSLPVVHYQYRNLQILCFFKNESQCRASQPAIIRKFMSIPDLDQMFRIRTQGIDRIRVSCQSQQNWKILKDSYFSVVFENMVWKAMKGSKNHGK